MQFATKDGSVIMAGYATKNAEVRYVGEEKATPMATFSLAVGKRKDESTIFVDFVAFKKMADYASQILKGDNVFVVGKIQERKYTNKDGEEKTSRNVLCDWMNVMSVEHKAQKLMESSLDIGSIQKIIEDSGASTTSNAKAENGFAEVDTDEDLPF